MQTKAFLDVVSSAAGGRWSDIAELAGRILLAVIFLLSGLGKIASYGTTAAFMASMGVPGALLPIVIATEVLGGLGIMIGWKTRFVAFLMGGFTLLTAVLFHSSLGDQEQMTNFLKNLSMTGGFLLLVVHGAGSLSIDRYFAK